MRTHALVAAAALISAGAITGCEQTTMGTVALSTESGGPTTSATTSRTSSTPSTSASRTSSSSAPPWDVLALTCGDYVTLDADAQTSVLEEILAQPGSLFAPGDVELAKILVDGTCSALPQVVVSEFLRGVPPP